MAGGFILGDLPKCGMSVNVTTAGDQALADQVARRIARAAWADRARYFRPLTPLAEAVRPSLAGSAVSCVMVRPFTLLI